MAAQNGSANSRRFLVTLRTIVGKVLRRIVWKLDAAQKRLLHDDPLTKRLDLEQRRLMRLPQMYERARVVNDKIPGTYDANDVPKIPTVANVREVEREMAIFGAQDAFFVSITADEPFDTAAIKAVRELNKIGALRRARSFAQVLQSRPEFAAAGDIAMALVAFRDHVPGTSWELFARSDLAQVLRLAPAEYFRTGFVNAPDVAAETLAKVLSGELAVDASPQQWLEMAKWSFGSGHEDLSKRALDRAAAGAASVKDPEFPGKIEWLNRWYGQAAAAVGPVEKPVGAIPFAVLDYKSPDQDYASRNLGDHVQTISSLGHVVRHKGFRFSGDKELVGVADKLQDRVRADRAIAGDDAELALYRIDRDSTNYYAIPDHTWTIAFGWYMHPIFGMKYDLPFNPRLRPVFVAFHINAPALLTSDVIEYLRKYAPIGCRDWNTVYLLQAAGVPAFFSGCLTTTVDTVFSPNKTGNPQGTLFVDTRSTGPGDRFKQVFKEVRERPFADNIDDALTRLESYRSTYKFVATSRLHCYLPARSIGANVDFRPKNPADVRFDGLAFIDDDAYNAMRTGILEKLNVFMTAVGQGKTEEEVYALWRETCADDVAFAESKRRGIADIPEPTFDVAAACKAVHEKSVTIERTAPAPEGEEVNIEFSLDGNLKHQLAVVLESIVTKSSRPIRAYVLCRDHDQSDFDRISSAFPTVSFVWLPTDDVDYGEIIGMIIHITVATMDRLLLPELLPDVSTIVHHDLDALCLGDIAELADIELGDLPIGARTSPQPDSRSGFIGFIKASKRLKDNQELARELIIRSHTRHDYDFLGFNAGVMVLNLDRMRADDFCRHFLPYAERFGMNDQEILNAYAGGNRVEIPADWNRLPRLEIVDNPKIVHWAGFQKPWGNEYVQYRELWEQVDAQVTKRLASETTS